MVSLSGLEALFFWMQHMMRLTFVHSQTKKAESSAG